MPWVERRARSEPGRVVGRQVHEDGPSAGRASAMSATASSAVAARPPGRSGERRAATLLPWRARRAVAALEAAGSKTNPLRSITPATRSDSARATHVADEPGQRAPDLAEAEQHDLHPLGLG